MKKQEILEILRYALNNGEMSYAVRCSIEHIVNKLES